MTKREIYLKALNNEKVDELVWAPNFDYWLNVNTAEGTLPEKYKGVSRNDIVRSIGGSIWNRASVLKEKFDKNIKEVFYEHDGNLIHEFHTPIGNIREVHSSAEGKHRTKACVDHFVKDIETLKIRKYVVEGTYYEADYGPTKQAIVETGDDGVVVNGGFCVPFIQFAKTDAGYINGYYIWSENKKEVDSLVDVYFKKFLEGFKIFAEGPADVIATGDNMDGTMISPPIFKEYAIPFYKELKKITSEHKKILEGHWCGRTKNLLPMVNDCGLDVVEAIVTEPMDDIKLTGALDILDGRTVLQGGIPAVLVCNEGGSKDNFIKYIKETILPLKGRKGFILGMSDNVPPNADFSRVEMISKLIC